MFASKIPPKTLVHLSRSLGTMLDSGIQIRRALQITTKKIGHPTTRNILQRITEDIEAGTDLASAFRSHGHYFPALFLDMLDVAEDSGALPDVLKHLAEHYENNIRLKREFVQSIIWPAFQFVAAIFVVAILILVLGMVADTTGNNDLSFLVFGLSGPGGALIWLCVSFGSIAGVFFAYKMINGFFQGERVLDTFLIRIPILGHCMRAFAIARFSWAYYLTQQTGMPVVESLKGSLRATGNGAFLASTPIICDTIVEGSTLTDSLARSELFPGDYLEMVSVAEESGTVPEALHRLSPQFEETARGHLKTLTRAISVLVWLIVAGFILLFVFRFMLWYVGQINQALQGT